jgi:hypothetical protein
MLLMEKSGQKNKKIDATRSFSQQFTHPCLGIADLGAPQGKLDFEVALPIHQMAQGSLATLQS